MRAAKKREQQKRREALIYKTTPALSLADAFSSQPRMIVEPRRRRKRGMSRMLVHSLYRWATDFENRRIRKKNQKYKAWLEKRGLTHAEHQMILEKRRQR